MPRLLSCAAGHQWEGFAEADSSASRHALVCPVCGAAPTLESLGAPPATTAGLGRLRDDLERAAGKNLAGLILYGSLARGRYHAGSSDINIVVLLHDASGPMLAAVAPALRGAWRSLEVEPLMFAPSRWRCLKKSPG